MKDKKLTMGRYWIEWETKDNWYIVFYNSIYFYCQFLKKIETNDNRILSYKKIYEL